MAIAPVLPITAFVGANGHGKSLLAVELAARPAMERGAPILSNMVLRYDRWEPLVAIDQLLGFSGGLILLDEISSVFPSREFASLPAQLVRFINQIRKRRARLVWTAPSWARADVTLREVTQAVYVCRGLWPDRRVRADGIHRFPTSGRAVGRVPADQWASNRLFRATMYDAIAMDEFTAGRAEKIGSKYARWYWRPGHAAHRLYDSQQDVGLLDHLDHSGVCVSCHGTRRRPACSCKAVAGPDQPRTAVRVAEAPRPEGLELSW